MEMSKDKPLFLDAHLAASVSLSPAGVTTHPIPSVLAHWQPVCGKPQILLQEGRVLTWGPIGVSIYNPCILLE